MRQAFTLILVVLTFISNAQSYQETQYGAKVQNLEDLNKVCPPQYSGIGFGTGEKITPEVAEKIVNKILFELGIENQYKIRECKSYAKGNARAQTFVSNGRIQRFIVYDIDFLNEIEQKMRFSENPYGAIFVLAHEIGHHAKDHTLNFSGSEIEIELEADEYAGFMLAKNYGANLEVTLQSPRTEKRLVARSWDTHPGRIARMQAAFKGWIKWAENDPELRRESATFIKNYHEEIEAYRQEVVNKNNQKTTLKKKIKVPEPKKEEIVVKKKNTAEEVIKRYFEALGGIVNVNNIKTLKYQEQVERPNTGNVKELYGYHQKSPTLLFIENKTPGYDGEQYKISNDSLSYKYSGKKEWNSGLPKGETNEEDFKNIIVSSTGNFLEDFKLFASPNLVEVKDTLEFKGERCYRLDVKSPVDIQNFDNKNAGTRTKILTKRYYKTSDNLLHAIQKEITVQYFKRGFKPDGIEKSEIVNVLSDYKEVGGIKFPHHYSITKTIFEGNVMIDELATQKEVSDISVNPSND